MSKKKEAQARQEQIQQEIQRVKLPRGNEVFGIVEQRVGGSRAKVRCLDGRMRICRIPGRLKRRLWIREGDLTLIQPWETGGDEKGDIIFKYKKIQESYLQRKGYLKNLENMDDF